MKINRIILKGDFAHFKKPARGKIQQTYEIPPISTVVGILKNIYGEDIDDFILGYSIKYKAKHKDAMTLYKEVNLSERSPKDRKRFITDLCIVEYLYRVELTIYTDISKDVSMKDVLVLGKSNCLATLYEIKEIELSDEDGFGYNQYTQREIGDGQIRRINTLTKFNEHKDMYDIKSEIVRENLEFEYDKNYDKELEQNIYLWKWKGGKIDGVN